MSHELASPIVSNPFKKKTAKILVVDDEQGWRDLLTFELGELGYEVMTAKDGPRGLEILRGGSFDLVITDVRMPGSLDGIDLVETYRQENPTQKVIFITGYATEEKLERALNSKISFCLKKPFSQEDLTKMISQVLEL